MAKPIAIVGNLNVDQIVTTVERFPEWDEELLVESSRLQFAGTAGYLVLAAEALGLPTFCVSTVGTDAMGDFLFQELDNLGANSDGIELLTDRETCLSIIFVGREGKRSILTALGAHEEMSVDVARKHDDQVAECHEVFLCGAYLLPKFSPAHLIDYARDLRARGQIVVFDPSWDPAGWPDESRQETFDLLQHVDVFMPNREELCRLTRTETWEEGIRALGDLPGEVVVKLGADGAAWAKAGEVVTVPSFKVEAHNTVGAGDIFDMGYLFARRTDLPIDMCLKFGCACSAYAIRQTGERTYPDVAAINEFVRSFDQ